MAETKQQKLAREMSHRQSSSQMEPRYQRYLESSERDNPPIGLEQPLLAPLDFLGPAHVKSALNVLKKAGKGYGKLAAEAVARSVEGGSPLTAMAQPSYVIKNKGGNWLSGSVEDALSGLRARPLRAPGTGIDQPLHPQSAALNSWIDKQLTRYVRNDMATPEDPIRALAEKGVLHYEPALIRERSPLMEKIVGRRETAGFPIQGLGGSPLARSWENTSDSSLRNLTALDLSAAERDAVFGGRKVPKDTIVHELNPFASGAGISDLGFPHLIDELSNALSPTSGLPRELLLDANSLSRVSVPQAVERVAKINAYRAEQARLADLEKMKVNLLQKPFKEYEGGWRWAELPDPEASPENMKLVRDIGCQGGWCTQGEDAALTYGAHSRGNRLYGLIDSEGRPHVQIQTQSGYSQLPAEIRYALNKADLEKEGIDAAEWLRRNHPDVEIPSSILQIKPFSNTWDSQMVRDFTKKNPKYKEEILPFVQDFVRSGKWSDVGDLGNTGLRKLPDNRYITNQQFDEAIQRMTGEGEPSVNAEWFQRQIRSDPKWWENAKGAFEGFAQGGRVQATWPFAQGGRVDVPVAAWPF